MAAGKVVLITGASMGIGQATAIKLIGAGYRVFGTSREPGEANAEGLEMLALDVTSDESVQACFDELLERAGRLDILINNAGSGFRGAVEESSVEEAKAQFEVNFFSVVRTTRLALPVMRKQGGGHIINVSSVVGRVSVPYNGVYSASKFAVEGYTEALRYEVAQFGIKVSMVEPGVIVTNFADAAIYSAEEIDVYGKLRQFTRERIKKSYETSPGPEIVADTIFRIINSRSPRLRYPVGRDAVIPIRLKRWLPASWFEGAVKRIFKT